MFEEVTALWEDGEVCSRLIEVIDIKHHTISLGFETIAKSG